MPKNNFKNKVILLTGGTGSLGTKLVERLLPHKPKEIRIFSRSETLQDKMRRKYPSLIYILGDVRDYFSVKRAMRGVNIVIHAAAFKYLDLSEAQPRECVLTNVNGTLNIIQAAELEKPEYVVGISTDKAPYARNVYGCTKQIMEKLLEEANRNSKTNFLWVRYGNVIGTTGSVIPRWIESSKKGEEIYVTDFKMTRFFFTLDEAIDVIFKAIQKKKNIVPLEMKAMSIQDLAEEIIMKYGGNLKQGKIRAGEKLHETLIPDYEGKEYTSKMAEKYTREEIRKILEEIEWRT